MSRLDSAIRRLSAQRDCLAHAAALIGAAPGVVLEIGLGNGRTYDHMRWLMPGRDIYVFERQVAAHPDCIPDPDHLILGDFRETMPGLAATLGAKAVLAHCDVGNGDHPGNARLAAALAPLLVPLLAPGAIVASDQPLHHPALVEAPLPATVRPGRYSLYRLETPR